jgi:hypothetical protein
MIYSVHKRMLALPQRTANGLTGQGNTEALETLALRGA